MRRARYAAVTAIVGALALAGLPAGAQTPEGVLFVTAGKVGINTPSPAQPLHLVGPSGGPGARFQFDALAPVTSTYTFQIDIRGNFAVTRQGDSKTAFQVRKADDAGMGSTLIVNGSVQATNFKQASSRELKTAFAALDGAEVLEKVAALPISSWSFKSDAKGERHVGPMAEDFHAAFGLGSGARHISTGDATGIALAAIQGLQRELAERDRRIEELVGRLEALERRFGDE